MNSHYTHWVNAPSPPVRHDSREVPISVVEQRVSDLAQGTLCVILPTGPFLHVLSLIPRGVLTGLLYGNPSGPDQTQPTPIQLVYGAGCFKCQRDYDKDPLSHP